MSVHASIITIGDELLIGQVVDTNSAFIAQQLNKNGFALKHRVAVGDVWDDIWNALDAESKLADIIIITGGLGPTADDITKPLLCQYFGGKMVLHQPTLEHVQYLFEQVFKRPGPLLERNRKQAEVPDVCTVLKNEKGTAPGMLFEKEGKLFFSLPGVPHEMQWLMLNQVLPVITQRFTPGVIEHRTLLTAGIGESSLAELIKDFEEALPAYIKLAYLPSYGMVRLRLTGTGNNKHVLDAELDALFTTLQQLTAAYLVTNEDIPLDLAIGKLLLQKNATIATAESCTGGYIAHLLSQHAGASAYYKGSIVSYANQVKQDVLQVTDETLNTVGAVSEETVIQMATHARTLLKTDYAIAVSGIMGPTGGTDTKPVGTVWVAVAGASKTATTLLQFRFDRLRNIQLTAINAINFARKFILEH